MYVSNPALGDPNMLAEKVEENAQKLDALQQELLKYEVSGVFIYFNFPSCSNKGILQVYMRLQ